MKKLIVLVLTLTTMMAITMTAYAVDSSFINPGDYNTDVIALHEKLIQLGYFNLRAESPFGPQSADAVRTLQANRGLEQTGIIASREELDEILALDHVTGLNLLTGYVEKMQTHPYLSTESLDGEPVLHFDYRDSESEDYVNVVSFGSVLEPFAGAEYTLSFMAKGTGRIHTFFYPSTVAAGYSNQGGSTNAVDGHMATDLSEEWTKYIFTWRTKSDVEGIKNVLPIRVFKGTEVWVSKIKFERGCDATEWVLPKN